jgi:hypothetical protein
MMQTVGKNYFTLHEFFYIDTCDIQQLMWHLKFWRRTDNNSFFVVFDAVCVRLEILALRRSFVPLFSEWSSIKEADILDFPDNGLSVLFRTVNSYMEIYTVLYDT